MTTIAVNKSCMASDSKVTHGDTFFHALKICRVGHTIVGAAGNSSDIGCWLRWYRKGKRRPAHPEFATKRQEIDVVVLTPDGIFLSDEGGHFEEVKGDYYAIGNGQVAALVAMDLGCDPAAAIDAVSKRDNMTGGPVQVLSLDDK